MDSNAMNIRTNLNSLPIGYTRVINGEVITRWSDGFQFNTINRRNVKTIDETVNILAVMARLDAYHGVRLR
jgi:hypothetical protein